MGSIARSSCGTAVAVSFDFTLILKILFKRSIYRAADHLANNSLSEAVSRQYAHKLEILANELCGKTVIRTTGPKPVDKILVDTRQQFDFGIPDYTVQLTELRDF